MSDVRLLLGPQRPTVNLAEAIAAAGLAPVSIAVISAGWQEAENDIDDIRAVLGIPLVDLCLYGRTESVFEADANLAAAYRQRQEKLQEQQRLYRLRLRRLAAATREMLRADSDAVIVAAEQRHAFAQLKALDRHHIGRTELAHREFEEQFNASRNPELARHRHEIAAAVDRADAVLITGGNIIVLLNRLRLFDMAGVLSDKPVIGWSAGAMALTERVVLFHDRMPHGRRDAEVLGHGLGLVGGTIVFPDSAQRLRSEDRLRISFMSRRFAPDACLALDSGSAAEFHGSSLVRFEAARKLARNGRLTRLKVA